MKKQAYFKDIANSLQYVSTAKEWWKIAKEIRGDTLRTPIGVSASEFKIHFQNLLTQSRVTSTIPYAVSEIQVPELDYPIELNEIYLVISSSKDFKTPGLDGIPYEFYKNASPSLVVEIHKLFIDIFESANVPFKKSIIYSLYKKGDVNVVSNYRGLSFLDTLYKLFTSVLLNRLTTWLEANKIINEFQAAYRTNYSTVDQVYNLSCLIQLQLSQKKKLYAFFIDLKAAFDNVDRHALFYKLHILGISAKMIKMIKCLYLDTTAAIWDGKSSSDFFNTNKGVKQGCVLSALLFVLFLNDLYADLPIGLSINGLEIKVLLYADDIVLLSDNPANLQRLIDSFITYCNKWNLEVNLGKSEVVIFRNGGRRAACEKWFFNDIEITVSNQYKYLGVVFNYNMSWNELLNSRLASSKNSINETWAKLLRDKSVQHSTKFKIYDAAARAIMLYCAQVWGYREHIQVEKLQRFFLKRCFLLPDNTPNYVLHIETGLPKAFLTHLKLHFSYIRRTLSLSTERLPRILSQAVMDRKIFWAKEWLDLFYETSMDFSFDINLLEWRGLHSILLSKLKEKQWNTFTSNAIQSQFHDEYCNLLYCEVPNYFEDLNPRDMISLILKARCGLLNLNGRAFQRDTNGICTLCNLDASENTFHFVGICPIFKGYRRHFLGNDVLSHSQLLSVLNGNCYINLYNFLKAALKYRYLILNEFS